jgi:hypothetical protein
LTAPQGPGSRFRVRPDPPVAGQPCEVTYLGPASQVEWQIDGGAPTTVQPDANGRFKIDPLPSGRALMLSDNLGLPGYQHRRIVETLR